MRKNILLKPYQKALIDKKLKEFKIAKEVKSIAFNESLTARKKLQLITSVLKENNGSKR